MRLLNTQTLELAEFFEANVPEYTTLSHTWGHDEVTYQHIQSLGVAREMQGFAKIEGACRLAASEGFKYIWIDTCCIDKSSSAELSEAINSMYSWYQKSARCYAYLADVNNFDLRNGTTEFRKSRWYTRGWTLQELIAPSQVAFYSRDWTRLGTKLELRELISRITGIDISILAGADHRSICVARKMFWASRRQTTRVEDMAYCLLGLFSVNMPLMYGEGKDAFIRLQKKIIKMYDDQSIFAWSLPAEEVNPHQLYGLLAESPRAFKETGNNISSFPSKHPGRQATGVRSTGLEIELLLQPPTYLFGLRPGWRTWSLLLFSISSAMMATIILRLLLSLSSALLAALDSVRSQGFFLSALVTAFTIGFYLLQNPSHSPLARSILLIISASANYVRPAAAALRQRGTAALADYLKPTPRSENRRNHLALLDCRFTGQITKHILRPCIEIVALGSQNSTDYSSFARRNVSKLEARGLNSDIVSPRFKHGLGRTSLDTWPIFEFIDACAMHWQALWLQRIPWEFRKVFVSHGRKEILPVGFRLLYNRKSIQVIEGYPLHQWFQNDDLLRRKSTTMDGRFTNNATSGVTEEVVTVTDGVVRLKVSELVRDWQYVPELDGHHAGDWAIPEASRRFQHVCLSLGMRHVRQPSNGMWVQNPVCRMIGTNPEEAIEGFMNVTNGEDFAKIQAVSGKELDAKIEGLDYNGLYIVSLCLHWPEDFEYPNRKYRP